MQKIHAANISLYFVTLVPPNTSDIGILSSISSVFFTSSGVNKISDAPAFSFKRSSFLVPGIGTRYVWISFLLYKFFYYIFLMDIKEPVSIYLYLPSATRYLIACLAFGNNWTSSKIITDSFSYNLISINCCNCKKKKSRSYVSSNRSIIALLVWAKSMRIYDLNSFLQIPLQ